MPSEAPIFPSTAAIAATRKSLARRRGPPAGCHAALMWNRLRRLFWLVFVGLISFVGLEASDQTYSSKIGALLIIVAAMLPSYLWISGKVRGLPIFPAFTLTYIWTFAMPLVSDHRIIVLFPTGNQLIAALTVIGFLLLGTLAWYLVARRPSRIPQVCWMMNEAQNVPLLLIGLAGCAGWTMSYSAGWIQPSAGVDSLIRAVQMPIEALACFVLSYRLGCGKLVGAAKAAFFTILGFLILANLPALLLVVAMSLSAVSLLAYVAGSKRLPWCIGVMMLCIFGFLHLGKAEMREKHWHEDEAPTIQPLQYPGFLMEWITTSWDALRHEDVDDERGESLLERASLLHWLLYFQQSSPGAVPYLNGATYALIPHMVIPRILNPDKPLSTEGNSLLAIHYGIQTREDTVLTTIGFGLLNEAYANFGFVGVGMLAVVLGTFYGQVARWARRLPILSFRGLFSVLIANYAIQTEFSSTFYMAALFQSTAVLTALAVVFMRPIRITSDHASLLD